MKNRADWNVHVLHDSGSTLHRVRTDSDHHLRTKCLDHLAKRVITDRFQRDAFPGRQLVRSPVSTGFLQECEWTPVPDEEPVEECIGTPESFLRPSPEPSTADLASRAVESLDGTFRVLMIGFPHRTLDPEEIPHMSHLPEGDAGLRHPPGPGIHPEHQCLPTNPCILLQIALHCLGGIVKWRVDMRDRLRKGEGRGSFPEFLDDLDGLHVEQDARNGVGWQPDSGQSAIVDS